MSRYAFSERLVWSEGYLDGGIARILRDRIPGCYKVERADTDNDRNGTDYWAVRANGLPPLSIDVKVRSVDYAQKGHDDLALETWSVLGSKIGWTRDPKKRTDFILWYWADTTRFVLVSFPALCRIFRSYWKVWHEQYKCDIQTSDHWQSECVYVPRNVVMEKIMAWENGYAESGQATA